MLVGFVLRCHLEAEELSGIARRQMLNTGQVCCPMIVFISLNYCRLNISRDGLYEVTRIDVWYSWRSAIIACGKGRTEGGPMKVEALLKDTR